MFASILLLSLFVLIRGSPLDRAAKELNQLSFKASMKEQPGNSSADRRPSLLTIEEAAIVKDWPSDDLLDFLGQVSGLSFCPMGFLYVFHRADRDMDPSSFDVHNRFLRQEEGPIEDTTILRVNNRVDDPRVINAFGENLFYLPHGIFADKTHLWTTDLALHQVLRFPHGSKTPDLVLGERFVPGNDQTHFCKPSHAITSTDGSLFVADGYCNSRIVKFDKSGKFVMQFGDEKGPGQLSLPHHLVLIEEKDLICVADRQNNRVQCFGAGIQNKKDCGKVKRVIQNEKFGPVYAIGFNTLSGVLYIISGITEGSERSRVYLYNWDADIITGAIDYPGVTGFGLAHTISVCPRQRCVAIGSLTKECPSDIETCQERSEEDSNYLPRNIWLYGLSDETVELE